jgi:precorrin-6B methylase 2
MEKIMDFYAIDWDTMWSAESKNSHWQDTKSQKELWDRRAESFDKRINRVKNGEPLDKDDYISQMLDRIEVRPDWSVLDIGCGPGTLTIPLAKKSRSVTALDISSEMLKRLKINADKNSLSNIKYLNSAWQDAFSNEQVGRHDVVVASRSMISGNIKEAISTIAHISRKAAYITFPIVHLPFDWEVYQAIGRDKKKHPPYIYVLNMLFQMGIPANVEVLYSRVKVQFASVAEAMKDLQWRTDPFSPEEEAKIQQFLEIKFTEQKNSPVFTHEGNSKWALIWWRRENPE